MGTMAFKMVDRLFLVAFGMSDPTEEEWLKYLKLVEAQGVERTMQLIYTEGGEPTPRQRKELVRLLAGRAVPMAVLSNKSVRVGMLSWFNRQIRGFSIGSHGLIKALEYLEIPSSRFDLIDDELGRLILSVRIAA